MRQGLEGCEFSHLSFQEFLAAAEIKALKQESKLYPYLKDANISNKDKAWWCGTILLYASQVNPIVLIEEALKQDAPDLAFDCWQETQYTIDPIIEAQLKTLEPTLRSRRYSKLELLLKAGEWRAADRETYRLMITTVGKDEGQEVDREDLENFPCEDLRAIDNLWVTASNGHFGFSVQKKIWEKCGSPMSYNNGYEKFMKAVGWLRGYNFVSYKEYKFSSSLSPTGELPVDFEIAHYLGPARGMSSVRCLGTLFSRSDL